MTYNHGNNPKTRVIMDAWTADFNSLGVKLERQLNTIWNFDLILTDKKRKNGVKMAGRENLEQFNAFKMLSFAKTCLEYSKAK